jgi:hypothetical protein
MKSLLRQDPDWVSSGRLDVKARRSEVAAKADRLATVNHIAEALQTDFALARLALAKPRRTAAIGPDLRLREARGFAETIASPHLLAGDVPAGSNARSQAE